MNDTTKLVLVFAGVVAGVLAWTAWQGETAAPGPASAWAGAKVDWGKPAAHGCDASWMGAVLDVPHPVYRQWKPGATRTGLIRYGWSWITDPPSEQGTGDE